MHPHQLQGTDCTRLILNLLTVPLNGMQLPEEPYMFIPLGTLPDGHVSCSARLC